MSAESIPDAWLAAFHRAEQLDPIIREALRPVYDRLLADTPEHASAFAMAMICRALRMIEPPPGATREQVRGGLAQLCAAYVAAYPEHP